MHAAHLDFYVPHYRTDLQTIQKKQRLHLDENVASQKDRYAAGLADRSAFTSASVQASELDSQVETAARAYQGARTRLAESMALDLSEDKSLPEPEGKLGFAPVKVDLDSETAAALQRRADIRLARLMVRAANEDERIIAAGYYPVVNGTVTGDYIPVSGIHREGSTSRTEDFLSSEIREGAHCSWQVIDNGKVTGAVLKQRMAREINEIACRKLETNVGRELARLRNDLAGIDARHKSFANGTGAAEQSTAAVQQNLGGGLASQLEYRLSESSLLKTQTGLLETTYQQSVALAEWDRATGSYFQFSEDVH
jgi:outer membrane protein TolC